MLIVADPVVPDAWLSAVSGSSIVLEWGGRRRTAAGMKCAGAQRTRTSQPGAPGVTCVAEAGTSYTISPVPGVNTYYAVRGINGVGQKSDLSNRVGLFRFTLVPGA